MKDLTHANFGYLVAYLLPGFVIVWALQERVPLLAEWLGGAVSESTTVGGFLYATLAAVAAGMMASTIRWAVLDTVHHATGVKQPRFVFANLAGRVDAFEYLIEIHYRYYQFYSNMLVAMLMAYGLRRPTGIEAIGWSDAAFVATDVLLFWASRDCLVKYYQRVDQLLRNKKGSAMLSESAPRPEGH